jgi:ABC-type uncharacterized transport system permease subunit
MEGVFLLIVFLFYLTSAILFWITLFTKNEKLHKVGLGIFGLGIVSQIAYIGYMDIKLKTFAINTFGDIPSLVALIIGIIFFILMFTFKRKIKDLSAMIASINTILIALSLPLIQTGKTAKFNNLWFSIHIISSALAFALILMATVTAIIYIWLQRKLKKKDLNSFIIDVFKVSLDTIYRLIYILNIFTIISLMVAFITSIIWEKYAGKGNFIFSFKNFIVSFLILYYGIIIHIHLFSPEKRSLQVFGTALGGFISLVAIILLLLGHK